ncbi:tetratricopeptide repeat protein [Pseudoalteromonas sp. R3]|nr:tetratricopeptide repeat protein [Pseudoalteromonas sp. R3]
MNKTCFVISPIGDKGTEIRTQADALYDLIIEPALEKYDFHVTRADKSASVSSITSEIVQLVQDSGLCIIDITGHNPNVMYECGRRHETAKPYIMVAAEGETLPFDINTIRTIFYNLEDPREIRNTVKIIQSVIDKMLESGLEPERSGESLVSLSDTLTRIERKIDRISTVSNGVNSIAGTGTGAGTIAYQEVVESLGLGDAFNYALSQRDIGLAEYLLPNLEKSMPHEKFVDYVLTQAAAMGSIVAHQRLEACFPALESYNKDLQKDYIGSLVAGYNMQDRENDGLEILGGFFDKVISTETPSVLLSNKDKAFYLNQYSRLLHGCGEYEKGLEIAREIIQLSPEEPSYIYNFIILCERSGLLDEALTAAKKLYALIIDTNKEPDDDHLEKVVRIFAENNSPEIKEVFSKLEDVNNLKATMLLRNSTVKAALNG